MLTVEQSLRALLDEQAVQRRARAGGQAADRARLVHQLAAPRSAVRRALESLERDGLIIRHVGRGTFLVDPAPPGADSAPPDTSPSEIMQARLAIEPPVAALAARVATQADIDRIGECLRRGGASDDFEGFEGWDARLHRAIAVAAHNGLLLGMFDVMNTGRSLPVWGSLKRRTSSPERRACYHEEHTHIVSALADRDPAEARESHAGAPRARRRQPPRPPLSRPAGRRQDGDARSAVEAGGVGFQHGPRDLDVGQAGPGGRLPQTQLGRAHVQVLGLGEHPDRLVQQGALRARAGDAAAASRVLKDRSALLTAPGAHAPNSAASWSWWPVNAFPDAPYRLTDPTTCPSSPSSRIGRDRLLATPRAAPARA